jgi:hypothetical protein
MPDLKTIGAALVSAAALAGLLYGFVKSCFAAPALPAPAPAPRQPTLEDVLRSSPLLSPAVDRLDMETVLASSPAESPRPIGWATHECSICYEHYASERPRAVLVPCGHVVCKPCADQLTVCSACRAAIERAVRIYE